MRYIPILFLSLCYAYLFSACNEKTTVDDNQVVVSVDSSLFLTDGTNFTITIVPCTLSDGTNTDCYQIVTNSMPSDHTMGPWCPDNISDDASKGGIWLRVERSTM